MTGSPTTPSRYPAAPRAALAAALCLLALGLSFAPARAQTFDLFREHDRRARELVEAERHEDALAEWREALKLDPKNIIVRRNMGIVLLKLGRVEEAEEVLLEAVEVDPDQAATHLQLGRVYLRQGKTALAEAELYQAQRLEPTNPSVDISLAVLAMQKADYASAERHLQRALTFNFDDADAHAALGDVYRAQGEWDKAEASYQAALRLEPFHLGAKRGLQEAAVERSRGARGGPAGAESPGKGALRIENPRSRIEAGRYVVEGEVLNTHSRATANYVTVVCQFYDRHQRIVTEAETHPKPETLGPGERGFWSLVIEYTPELSGKMEIGVKAIIEDPESEIAREGAGAERKPAFFGGGEAAPGDVLKVSIPELATSGGKTLLKGFVLNVGKYPVASVDLNFLVTDRTTGRLKTQQFARIDKELIAPGGRADYFVEWQEGLDPKRFRFQMKVGWTELGGPSAEEPPGPEAPAQEAPPPAQGPPPYAGQPRDRLPTPIPEPLPSKPKD